MGSSLSTLFDPNSLPSKQEGETLAQYAMRTAGLTGFDTSGLGAFVHMASSLGAGGNYADMIRKWQEMQTGQMTPEQAQQWGYSEPPPPTTNKPITGVLGPPSITAPVTQNPIQPPPPPAGGVPPPPPGAAAPNPAGGNMSITPPGGFLPGMEPGTGPQAAGTYRPPQTLYPGKTGGPLPTISATAPREMPAAPPLPPPRSLQPTPPMTPGQAPVAQIGHSSSLNDGTFNGLSQQRLAQIRALAQTLAAPQGQP